MGSATRIQWVKATEQDKAQDSPHHTELLAPDVQSAKGEKLMCKIHQELVTLGDREGAQWPWGAGNALYIYMDV